MQSIGEKNIDVLWKHFLGGDKKSFALIYQEIINGLFLYGKKFSSDRELVQDCIQEVFIEIYSMRKGKQKKIIKLKPYLFVAVRNRILKRISRESKIRVLDQEEQLPNLDLCAESGVEEKFIIQEQTEENQEKLKRAVDTLTSKQKEIIYLRFNEELDYNEISEIMKISVESARKSMYRALMALREKLEYSN